MINSSETRVTTVIVTYESRDTIGEALDALDSACRSGFAKCVVVDNASADGTAKFVETHYPWVTLIAGEQNIGYGRGCNLGLTRVQTPYVVFMNPDVQVNQDALHHLVRFAADHPLAGVIGPAIKRQAGDYQCADCLPTPKTILRQAVGLQGVQPQVIQPGAQAFRTNWVCGAVMFASVELMRRLGGFDPRFFLYFEETDLCLRVARAGFEVWALPAAETGHASNASARKVRPELVDGGCLEEHFYPSRFYYLNKHYGRLQAVLVEMLELVVLGLRDIARLALLRNRPSQFSARLRAPLFCKPTVVDNH
ncbi:MAG: glycosyltransferase family 2 protein [Bacteroidia bacterium]|nr:glycosyltransferase family 2 protein [Bacteroidia bacterium]